MVEIVFKILQLCRDVNESEPKWPIMTEEKCFNIFHFLPYVTNFSDRNGSHLKRGKYYIAQNFWGERGIFVIFVTNLLVTKLSTYKNF